MKPLPAKLRIGGFVDLSTIDWHRHLAFMIFTSGCPFRCVYCQNASLIPMDSGQEVDLGFIKQRVKGNLGLIDAVGFSGGEPTIQPKAVIEVFQWAKKIGLQTFLNTNGVNPQLIKRLIDGKLIDHLALSVLAPLRVEDYRRIMGGVDFDGKTLENVKESIRVGLNSKVSFEVRTTIVPGLIDDERSVREISRSVKGCGVYILQQYDPLGDILDPRFKKVEPPKRGFLIKLAKAALGEGIAEVHIRTREYGEEEVA